MADCPGTATCPFFTNKMANMPAAASALKRAYCQGTFHRCARLLVKQAMGKEAVPPDLLPADLPRARKILQDAGHPVPS